MKHVFYYVDNLMKLFANNVIEGHPNDHKGKLRTKNDILRAEALLSEIKKSDKQLRRLIDSHKTKKHMDKLLNSHKVDNWANHVETTFERLDKFLKVLGEDIPKLEYAIKKDNTKWGIAIQDISHGYFHSELYFIEKEIMKCFLEFEVLEIDHVKELLDDSEYIENMLK